MSNPSKSTMITEEQTHDLFAVRLGKLQALCTANRDPFGANWEQRETAAEAKALFVEEEREVGASPEVSVAGRIMVFRVMGKASFVKIQDQSGQIQLYVKRDEVGGDEYQAFKRFDLGDIVGAKGTLFKTKTGEVTIRVSHFELVAKALRPLPEKWHGLTDSEQIYRQRYLDLIVNAESKQRFVQRSRIIAETRQFLWTRDYLEIETPCLHSVAGGAAARPFVTHMNALDHNFFLRIALELHLKRMLVGGFDRVFEVGRVFRNEGLSRKHNPEFTMLELYQAYSDYRGMMEVIHSLIQHVCHNVMGSTIVKRHDGSEIELSGPWREARYKNLVMEATDDGDWFSRPKEQKLAWCQKAGIEVNPALEDYEVTGNVFEKRIEPTLIQPTFVTHLPKELCPLAKVNKDDPSVIDVFELCINGQELAPAYSEQNNPIVQKEMFLAQIGEEVQNMDYDFITALEHGMPPAGGMGVGIDRLCILLTGAASIRDTILFPAMKPADL